MNGPAEEDLRYRILRLLDGEADGAEVARLDAELRKDPEVRRLYLEYAQLHNALESRCVARTQIGQAPPFSIEKLLIRQRRLMVRRSLLAAAATLLFGFIALWMMVAERRPAALASFEVAPNSDFSVTHPDDSHGTPTRVLRAGSRLMLTTGVLEGKFGSGVRFVAEAPCELHVLTKSRIAMKEGGGWFEVPPGAEGFTVETGRIKVVDLGTRFGVVARSGKGHEIHVEKGRVEVNPAGGGKSKLVLEAGQARRLEEDGKFAEIPMDSSRFATSLPEVPVLGNPGFESLEIPPGERHAVGYGPIPKWGTSGGTVGSSSGGQPFLNQPAHSGERVAFIQNKGAIAQSASGFDPAKTYTVTYFVSERGLPGASTRTSVSLDLGTSFHANPDPIAKTEAFRRIVSGPLHVYGPAANIEIRAYDSQGDASLLIDSVSLSRAVPFVPDGGFENPVQPPRSFRQADGSGGGDLGGSAWRFSAGGGITANRSDFHPPLAPEGSQAAVLQNEAASMETTVHGFEPGVIYSLSFGAAGRKGGVAPFHVLLDGSILDFHGEETLLPPTRSYQTFTSGNFSVTNGSATLRIAATGEGSSFIDDLRFNFVAEAP